MHSRLLILGAIGVFGALGAPPDAAAAPSSLTLQHKHFLFSLDAADIRRWQRPQEQWKYRGHPVIPPAALRVDSDEIPPLPTDFERRMIVALDPRAIAATVERKITAALDRPPESVTIRREPSGAVTFDGVGLPGRSTDIPLTVDLILAALKRNVAHITLPVMEIPPTVIVEDPELLVAGIRELVTVGESDYAGSPVNRKHNIAVGVARFNGTLIPQGAIFSFNKILGPVDAGAGYREELVILGDKTIPDYGGGLCQVSTTAYRGIWEYGFPIVKRRQHSFAVRYYGPQGTDATVYPPTVDMQFRNDSPGALLVQTHLRDSKAYFLYYGTRDDRKTEIVGPYLWDFRDPPSPKTEPTAEIPPGETRKVGDAVRGMRALWYRIVRLDERETVESVASTYEARPLFHQVGVPPEELPPAKDVPKPYFLPL